MASNPAEITPADITPADMAHEREQMLRKLFNAVSHDLKTPLSCIIGSLEILEHMKGVLSEEQRATLIHTATSEARKLNVFISEMLEKVKP